MLDRNQRYNVKAAATTLDRCDLKTPYRSAI